MLNLEEKVGEEQAHRIELPGYIEDVERAKQTFGGQEGLAKAASNSNSILSLNLRPDCPEDHPIFGERYTHRGLLVKVKKGCSGTSASIIARVPVSYRFTGLADFQLSPDESLQGAATQDSKAFEEQIGEKEEPLLAVPPLFTRNDEPNDYQFRSYYGNDAPGLRTTGAGRVKGQLASHVVQWAVLSVPKPVDVITATFKPEKASLLEKLVEAFSERPIWTSLDLRERHNGLAAYETELVSKHAYIFRSGPFESAWVKRGYDPRSQPSTIGFQTVKYSLPPHWSKLLNAKKQASQDIEDQERGSHELPVSQEYTKLCKFEAVPKQPAVLQVKDLQDDRIQTILKAPASAQDKCDKITGWLKQSCWQEIVSIINQRFQDLLASHLKSAEMAETQDIADQPGKTDTLGQQEASNPAASAGEEGRAWQAAHEANDEVWLTEKEKEAGAEDFEIFEEDSEDNSGDDGMSDAESDRIDNYDDA